MKSKKKRKRNRPDAFALDEGYALADHEAIVELFDEFARWNLDGRNSGCSADHGRPGEGWDEGLWPYCSGGVTLPSERFYGSRAPEVEIADDEDLIDESEYGPILGERVDPNWLWLMTRCFECDEERGARYEI